MISGASDKELDIAIARADVLLELQPKIDELKKENQQLKEQLKQKEDIINKANKKIEKMFEIGDENKVIDDLLELEKILDNKGDENDG